MFSLLKEGSKLVIASHNRGKVTEIGDLLAPYRIDVVSVGELDLPEPEETGQSFEENALIKAHAAALGSGLPALSDDSGLVVPALDGAPGIYSARWAGPERDFGKAMQRLHAELVERQVPEADWHAHFICVLALAFPDGTEHCFEGRVDGRLRFPPRGEKGFGYDPIFVPEDETRCFADMAPEEKHRISHRARAFERFIAVAFRRAAS